jgi:hypothetical protein
MLFDRAACAACVQVSQALVPLVDEFASRLFAELDYMAEGRNAERFQELYGNMPRVRTPKIYWQATQRRVLTMEWIEGVKLTNKVRTSQSGGWGWRAAAAGPAAVQCFWNVTGTKSRVRQLSCSLSYVCWSH